MLIDLYLIKYFILILIFFNFATTLVWTNHETSINYKLLINTRIWDYMLLYVTTRIYYYMKCCRISNFMCISEQKPSEKIWLTFRKKVSKTESESEAWNVYKTKLSDPNVKFFWISNLISDSNSDVWNFVVQNFLNLNQFQIWNLNLIFIVQAPGLYSRGLYYKGGYIWSFTVANVMTVC